MGRAEIRPPNKLLFDPSRCRVVSAETRRLAAVMFTDIAGYSALTHADETRALGMLEEHRGIVRLALARFGGREVKTMGDGFLVEFSSALNALRCAEEIQTRVHERNETAGPANRIVLRIGIHLGDIVDTEGDLFGNAVNVAARIEPFAEPGGICVSRQVYDQVRSTSRLSLVSAGTHELKNIPEPLELFHVVLPWKSEEPARGSAATRPNLSGASRSGSSPIDRIVVLPFVNISAQGSDEFFSDGMTEELIEKLAHVAGLRVIARTTSMRFKTTRETARAIGHSLGVGTVVEGSVRKAGNRVRITVQLIDASTEEHLWSSSYDQVLDDIFAIQDDISTRIVGAISSRLSRERPLEVVSVPRTEPGTRDTEAYTAYLHGQHLLHAKGSETTIRQALGFFEESLRRDPQFVRARVGVASCIFWLGNEGVEPYGESVARARHELEIALADNDQLADAHSALALMMLGVDDIGGAKREANRAVELNPNFADPQRTLAQINAGEGDIETAVQRLEAAYQVDPLDLNIVSFLGRLYYYSGRESEALAHWSRTQQLVPFRTWANRTEYYLAHGDYARAEEGVHQLETLRPGDPWAYLYRGWIAARRGDRATAARMLEQLEALSANGSLTVFLIGFLHLALGDMDGFFSCQERAKEMHALPVLELRYSPLYAVARDDPRYPALMARPASS
jgi:adenylate cyclase